MKRLAALALAAVVVAPLQAGAADTASWANWTGLTGTFVQNSSTVTVTYTGDNFGVDHSADIYDVPTSFTNALVTNTPGTNGTILMVGGTAPVVNTFHFSQAVINPLMDVFSVGQGGVPVRFEFSSPAFSILASGAGHWGGGTLTQSGSTITGEEGNGLIQFVGTYTDISFTLPNSEFYYGATVGALANPVPEPETYAMLLAGLGLLGFIARRRKQSV